MIDLKLVDFQERQTTPLLECSIQSYCHEQTLRMTAGLRAYEKQRSAFLTTLPQVWKIQLKVISADHLAEGFVVLLMTITLKAIVADHWVEGYFG